MIKVGDTVTLNEGHAERAVVVALSPLLGFSPLIAARLDRLLSGFGRRARDWPTDNLVSVDGEPGDRN
jgi:hypothetical protein